MDVKQNPVNKQQLDLANKLHNATIAIDPKKPDNQTARAFADAFNAIRNSNECTAGSYLPNDGE